jgi:carboxymethylenebutenolidase
MGETIELTASDGHKFTGYKSGPANAKAGLVVIQEIFGVNTHIRSMTDRFGELGFLAIAPALFDRSGRGQEFGYAGDDMAKGREARGKLTEAGVQADVEAAAKALGNKPLGITGYCYGGTVSWNMACRSKLFKAASGWYGSGVAATRTETPNCPVQLHFGELDHTIPLTDIELIKQAQPGVEVYVYMGAQHGFGCDERASFNAPSFTVALGRTLRLFHDNLKA